MGIWLCAYNMALLTELVGIVSGSLLSWTNISNASRISPSCSGVNLSSFASLDTPRFPVLDAAACRFPDRAGIFSMKMIDLTRTCDVYYCQEQWITRVLTLR